MCKLDSNDFQTVLFFYAPACNKIEQNLEDIQSALCSGLATTVTPTQCTCDKEVEWTSITRTQIVHNNLQSAHTFSYTLPSTVPNTAKEVLLFVVIQAAYSKPHGRDIFIKLYTENNGKRFEQYIFAITYRRRYDWSYSSDNMWFPMTTNRRVYVESPRALSGVAMHVHVIGYR